VYKKVQVVNPTIRMSRTGRLLGEIEKRAGDDLPDIRFRITGVLSR
jgi:hypothetical protein